MSEISFGEEKKFSRSQIIGMIICLVAVILIAVISAVIVKESDSEPHIEVSDAKTKTVQFNLDPGTVYSHALTDNKLFFFSVDSLTVQGKLSEADTIRRIYTTWSLRAYIMT